jgi:hypothetical protein
MNYCLPMGITRSLFDLFGVLVRAQVQEWNIPSN